jgi:hypothetical protein
MIDPQTTQAVQTSHPVIAEWVKVLIGASVGFFLGIAGDLLKTTVNDWRDRRRMRRALYIELLNIYDSIRHLITVHDGKQYDEDTIFMVVNSRRLDAYEHAKQNPGVFYCLREAHSLDHAFTNMHEMKAFADKTNGVATRGLGQLFLDYIQNSVAVGRFNRSLLKRIAPDTFKEIEEDLANRPDRSKLEH